jgi:hypothetical protein
VLQELSERLLDELLTFGAGDDREPKRWLKIVTALATLGGSGDQLAERLRMIGHGKTAGFLYVLKRLSRGHWPSMRSFPADVEITLGGSRLPWRRIGSQRPVTSAGLWNATPSSRVG